ncbi:uncharacterized protein P174DRAFT_444306 [Aspergillus novofumigatus IBT 16806]|uniref:Uncharacterized protein n=1 Tax=Aspergillus novofumigatus (strain IBT 16806) TaxID=1392255 RepID=A0A2I1C3Q2_ASPN1|nr:uncharacterized protein P174DRAFT_446334 [Aspergillus novofumigatus IBT 16806]XP_024680857.1 uncharacterized protein P174DRAFT_444306 [Aspergillus novofumigatus IBT 16806]PKX88498.1 hypothetical protein P174DRAFT_446334 [Aspergillus novofumigatus IBT 16806]PKX92262.1 hypothetical protein P174DRAFT_444306 [Aspergillus novofumigatus IBT 16806]
MFPGTYESYVLLTQHTSPASNLAEVWVWAVWRMPLQQNGQIACKETSLREPC